MRELKFRFWNGDIFENGDELSIDGHGKLIDISTCFFNDAGNNGQHYTAQQYTGLKDKNGKEIYEGDIIKVDNESIEVEWLDWCAGFYPFNELNDDYERADINPRPENCEVIGNILENPELKTL